jgi:phosphoesterase RecJ-like protein
VISYVTFDDIQRLGLTPDDYGGNSLAIQVCKAVVGWNVTAMLIETNPGEVKCSFRTRDQVEFDVSKVALALGGGGHKAAAGATVKMPISEAVEHVEKVIREVLFN